MIFGNGVTEIPAAQIPCLSVSYARRVPQKKKKKKTNCGNAIAEIGKKKNLVIVAMPLPKMGGKKKLEWNCGNGIAETGKKKFSIVAMSLPKMGGKTKCGCRNLGRNFKKKSVTSTIFLQHFHNKLQIIVISSNLNLTLRLLF